MSNEELTLSVDSKIATITLNAKATMPDRAVHRLMDQFQKRLRFVSPLSFEISMPTEDWPTIFSELNSTLQSLDLCDTNTTGRDTTRQ